MGLEVSPERPLAGLVVQAITGHAPRHSERRGPYAPPVTAGSATCDLHDPGVAALCRWLLHGMLTGADPVAGVEDELRSDVTTWSPSVFTTSRASALDALEEDDQAGDRPLTELSIIVHNTDVVPPRVYLEWRLEGRFTNPCFVEDDLLVEPTGRLVETAGVLVVTFADDEVAAVHCYYDDLALLEQLLEPA